MHWILSIFLFLGQQSIDSATLTGRIEDATGARIPGVEITLTQTERNRVFSARTDGLGAYQFAAVPVGDYRIHIEGAGFAPYDRNLTLSLAQSIDLPIVLNVGSVSQTVAVLADSTPLETVRTQVAATVQPQEIRTLPLNGRNYLDLALLLPGVSKTNTGNNERFAETSAVPGTGISVAGQRNLNNGFIVDGLSANDDAADLAGTFFSPDVIREFQVVTSGGVAEFGRASTGTVNVVTQSGTNTWHGDLYGFFRNQRFDAVNVFAPTDPATGKRSRGPLTQAQYGASVGGPLRTSKAFLFSNFEQERLHRSSFITISPANVSVINTLLDQVGYQPPRVVTGEYPTGDVRTNYFAKGDTDVSASNRLSLRYSLYDIDSPNARNIGGLSTVSRGTLVAERDQTVAFNDVATLSARAVNEFRFQLTRSRFQAPGNDLVGPAVSISGVANFGASTSSPTARAIDMFEIADNISKQSGAHFVKAGVDVLHNRVTIGFPSTIYGTYSFSSLANFLAGTYLTFGQAFGKVDWEQSNPNVGWFVQDQWRLRRNLTLSFGLRHDVQWLEAGVNTRTTNFSPRIGLAWSPGRKTVVRSSFGQYYDRIPLRAIANAQRGAGTDYKAISLQRTQVGAPSFPNKLSAFPTGTLYNLATIDSNIKNGYALQSSLEIERELTRQVTASVGYMNVRGVHIITQRNLNVPTLTATQDPLNLGRPNPNFGNISQYSGQGDSYYNGMTVSVRHEQSRWVSARLSYTLSKTIDDSGNAFFSSPQDNFNLRDDRGLSDNDQRHRVTVSGQIHVPSNTQSGLFRRVVEGFQLSPIFSYGSAFPFNVVTGGQTIQATNARPAGVGRNTGKGFNSASLDLRLSRTLQIRERTSIEVIGESFNVLNRRNLQFPNNVFGTGTTPLAAFGTPTGAGDPRQVQFGLKISY